jgi:hypothetical protein
MGQEDIYLDIPDLCDLVRRLLSFVGVEIAYQRTLFESYQSENDLMNYLKEWEGITDIRGSYNKVLFSVWIQERDIGIADYLKSVFFRGISGIVTSEDSLEIHLTGGRAEAESIINTAEVDGSEFWSQIYPFLETVNNESLQACLVQGESLQSSGAL